MARFVTRFCLQFLSIHIQSHTRLIGIYGDICHFLRAVDIASAAYMYKWFIRQICFIYVEGVFPYLSVKGHQSFLILSRLSALVTSVSGEIKHIPAMHCPEIGTFAPHFQQMLMVNCLIILCPVTFFRFAALICRIGICSVLGQTNDRIRVRLMEIVKPLVILFLLSHIPSVIQIVAADIRCHHKRIIHIQHKCVSHRGRTGHIQLVTKVVQNPVIFNHIIIHTACRSNLIGKPPYHNGRMIIVLSHKLCHLGDGIVVSRLHKFGDKRNLSPDYKTLLIT